MLPPRLFCCLLIAGSSCFKFIISFYFECNSFKIFGYEFKLIKQLQNMRNPLPLYKAERTICCVYGCNSRISYKFYNGTRFHKLPFDPSKQLLTKWVSAIKLPRRICSHMIVCSRHFKESDYGPIDGFMELKPGSIPSQHLPKVWRNKFLPRNYGRLIKLIEVRGIGRLRMCYESKLARAIRKAENERREERHDKLKQDSITPVESNRNQNDKAKIQNNSTEVQDTNKVQQDGNKEKQGDNIVNESPKNGNNISQSTVNDVVDVTNYQNINNIIGNESEERALTSEIEIKDEPLSETEVSLIENDRLCSEIDVEQADWQSLQCNICGEEDCEGHEQQQFVCKPCGKQFRTSRQLNAHNLSHFEYRRRANVADKEAICKVCNKAIPSKVSLNDHMLTHSYERHVCMLCDKPFRNKLSLVMHINSHTIHTSHRCKICGQSFEESEELDRHVRKHRVLTREYTCRECGQRFRSKQTCWAHLNSHMRAKSKPGLPCEVCGRVLSTKSTLKEHMFIHSGEKPFECQLCGKKIRHRANFILHVQGHSLGQPHMCSICGMGFSKKTDLFAHTSAEHPEDRPFFCIICGMRFRTEIRFHKHAMTHDATLEDEV